MFENSLLFEGVIVNCRPTYRHNFDFCNYIFVRPSVFIGFRNGSLLIPNRHIDGTFPREGPSIAIPKQQPLYFICSHLHSNAIFHSVRRSFLQIDLKDFILSQPWLL